jgi:UDP-glucose 4-epimerase
VAVTRFCNMISVINHQEPPEITAMRILVCGGAGYIGSHMCKMLVARGYSVTVFDNLSTGHREAVRWGEFIKGDLLIPGDIERALATGTYAAVMHFSARSLVGESVAAPDVYYRNNVVGTLNLLDAMVRHRVGSFIFSSSAAVYGSPEYSPIDEQHPTRPINPYGMTKLIAESILGDYDSAFGLRSIALRYFNAAGADPDGEIGEAHDPETHLIPNILLAAAGKPGQVLKVFGDDYATADGTCVRDYIHVNDLCEAHILALQSLLQGGRSGVFNLGNGRGFSVLEVINAAREVTAREIPYSVVERRPGDPPVLVASSRRAESILGWRPRHGDIRSIIETAWKWHSRVSP